MPLIELGQFVYRDNPVKITQEEVRGARSTTFIITSGQETITMSGDWDSPTKTFTRTDFNSDLVDTSESTIRKLSGHIPYLGAEALGRLIETGIIDKYVSSETNNRSLSSKTKCTT